MPQVSACGNDAVPSPGVSASAPPAVMALGPGTMPYSTAQHGSSLGSRAPEPVATCCSAPWSRVSKSVCLKRQKNLKEDIRI